MNNFDVIPAIDLRSGCVVRLRQGDRDQEKVFDISPELAAEKWVSQGARWLHVVNLDGAFGEDAKLNMDSLRKIVSVASGKASVQFGGGLRDLASIDHILSLGLSRVILGTSAVRDPQLFTKALRTFGSEKVVLGVDAKDDLVRIDGWEGNTSIAPGVLIEKFIPDGLATVIFTNIKHDGMENGLDIKLTQKLARTTGLNMIASGGVASLEDIQAARSAGLSGVIVGKALYENNFSLSEALLC